MKPRPLAILTVVCLTLVCLTLALLTATAGCDRSADETAPKASPAADEPADQSDEDKSDEDGPNQAEASAAVAPDSPFAKYDLEAVAQRWQGSWVRPGSSLGTLVAWKVDGAKVTVFDGDEEKTLDFQVTAPCKVVVTEKHDGSKSSTHNTFAHGDSQVFSGLGSAGALTDQGAVVCTGGKVYELTDSGCAEWKERFGKWEKTGAECSLDEGTFQAGAKKLETVDGALVDTQMKRNEARAFETFEEAKAALAAEKTSSR